MIVRDTVTDEEYEVIEITDSTPNPDVDGEILISVVNPMGEEITMSVMPETKLIELEGNLVVLPPLDSPNQFEEVNNG